MWIGTWLVFFPKERIACPSRRGTVSRAISPDRTLDVGQARSSFQVPHPGRLLTCRKRETKGVTFFEAESCSLSRECEAPFSPPRGMSQPDATSTTMLRRLCAEHEVKT